MKYIKTKDGRIIKFNTSDIKEEIAGIKYDILGFRLKTTMQFYNLQKEDIVRIADTIEELCDEFVLVDTETGYCGILPKDKEIKFDKVNMGNAYGRKFYGAIWTDKGLIYVAKMNEKGELKLL